jgi:type I restriction enzyme S subunit
VTHASGAADTPEGWSWSTLDGIGTVSLGRQRSPKNHSGPFMRPYVRAANVTWSGWDLSDVKEMNFDEADFERFRLRDGDVVINEGSGSANEVGKPAIWHGEINNCCFQNTLLRVRPKACTPEFVRDYIRWSARAGHLIPSTQGVNIFHIGREGLAKFKIPIPPLAEQRRIVAKIDALSARSKRARADLDRIEALSARAKQAVLVAAFQGELTKNWRGQNSGLQAAAELVAKTPEPNQSRGGREATADVKPGLAALSLNDPGTPAPPGWAWVRLRRIARQETGHTPSRTRSSYWDGGVPWIGIRDAGAHHGRTINETIQTVSEEGLANSSARLLHAGTVCLSRTASVGYVTMMGRPMATSQDFATWTCTSALDPEYLMFAIMAEGDQIRDFGEGTTHTTIYFPEIRAFHICLAPKDEQAEIVRRVKLALARIDKMAEDARASSTLLDRLDQSILAKAFRGELVPQNPDDEPASVLLNRLRGERELIGAPKRRRRVARFEA